jgi:hypothetical protein
MIMIFVWVVRTHRSADSFSIFATYRTSMVIRTTILSPLIWLPACRLILISLIRSRWDGKVVVILL